MSSATERAIEIRNDSSMMKNCSETIMMAYADELGFTQEQAAAIATNFGGGMKCGATCGAITGALMVLGALGINNPKAISQFHKMMRDNHSGMTDCVDLLRENAAKGNDKKSHCDAMIYEAIDLVERLREEYNNK